MAYTITLTDVQDTFVTKYINTLYAIDKLTNPNAVLLSNQDFLQKYIINAINGWITNDLFRLKEQMFTAFGKLTATQQTAILTQLGVSP